MLSRGLSRWFSAGAAGLLTMGLAVLVAPDARSATTDDEACRPDGLYRTPGVAVPYCAAYDSEGREKLGSDHGRRVIGYFTSWRTGRNGAPAYLADDIPWDKVTHVNYAFAHVDGANRISVNASAPGNAATDMTWPGVPGAEMDPALPYQGHFNLLNKFKKTHPDVRTLISVGGWAETGGYFDDSGQRVDSGGFYRMTTNADGSINTAGITTFADSVVGFLRTYGFNGVDIDYEYPTSNADAGNPLDFAQANARRAGLNASYQVLMRTLREKLDAASAADGRYYLLTVAAPASGWLLRGMEAYQAAQYLDYINIMSYDLHGAWNQFVGPNAALYDDGRDGELTAAGVYSAYNGIGYLNTDWAAHYFRGSVPPSRVNIGAPYYTRGWRNVTGGTNGLWGTAPKTANCPAGTQSPCGDGAIGIDNLWHDLDPAGNEEPAGSNPMWHARNLQDGRTPSYLAAYGLTPATDPSDQLTGTYTRYYDATLVAPWLWNPTKKVFLSTEDEQSLGVKADYVVDQGLGGVMIWELAGDYGWDAQKGEWGMGSTLTTLLYDRFATAPKANPVKAARAMPTDILDVDVSLGGYALGDNNYPITPKLTITNRSQTTIPGGAVFEFDHGTSAPATMTQQTGWTLSYVLTGHSGNNVGGLDGPLHRVSLTVPSWQSIAPGQSATVTISYKLPISMPANWTLTFGGRSYRLTADLPRGTASTPSPTPTTTTAPPSPTPTTTSPTPGPTPTATSPSPTPGVCALPSWDRTKVYLGDDRVSWKGHNWRAKWWTTGEEPGTTGEWGVWQDLGPC